MVRFGRKRPSTPWVADEGGAGRVTRFQLVPDDAFIALGTWGESFLNSPLYAVHIAPRNVIDLPEQIAGWLQSEPGPSNPALDAYHGYVTKLIETIFVRAKQDARSEPTDDWTSQFWGIFAAGLAMLIDSNLKPKVCSGEYPISRVSPPPRLKHVAATALPSHPASATAPTENKRGRPMCMLTYLGDGRQEAVLSKFSSAPLGQRLTGKIAGGPETGNLIIPMRGTSVLVMVVDAPLPLAGLPDDLAQRAAWPGWPGEAAKWRSHAIVSSFGEVTSPEGLRHAAEDVLLVAATLAAQSAARGVEWTASELFYPAVDFVRICQKTPLPPDILFRIMWYQTRDMADAGAITKGLHLFDLPEIRYCPSGEPYAVVYNRLLNLAAYLVACGPILKDGDTIGVDENVQASIRHARDSQGELMIEVVVAPVGG